MIVEQSLLAGISGGAAFFTPPTPSRYRYIALIIAAFARTIAATTGIDYATAHARVMALPDELADYLESADGWRVIARITSLDADFRPVVH